MSAPLSMTTLECAIVMNTVAVLERTDFCGEKPTAKSIREEKEVFIFFSFCEYYSDDLIGSLVARGSFFVTATSSFVSFVQATLHD